LNYDRVYRLKRDHPAMEIVINGGIGSLAEAEAHLRFVDGVMLGRAAYEQPYILSEVDRRFFGSPHAVRTREEMVLEFMPYIVEELAKGTPLARMTRHMFGLFHGQYGGRLFRRILFEESHKPGAKVGILHQALAATQRAEQLIAAE
jgi:tRNA-dihydrouridine synthase A